MSESKTKPEEQDLPAAAPEPEKVSAEMPDEELDRVAGGWWPMPVNTGNPII